MPQPSPTIAETARKNERAVLRAFARVSQTRVAELMGVSDSTVSRLKEGDLTQLCALLAACGLKCVSEEAECFDPQYVRALKVMAGVGLQAPEPRHLDWDSDGS